MRPTRKPSKPTTARTLEWFTVRLYACGHEHVTRNKQGPPADACPTCGHEKSPTFADARMRRSVERA